MTVYLVISDGEACGTQSGNITIEVVTLKDDSIDWFTAANPKVDEEIVKHHKRGPRIHFVEILDYVETKISIGRNGLFQVRDSNDEMVNRC